MIVLEMHRMSGLEKGRHSLAVITQFPDAKACPELEERMPVGFKVLHLEHSFRATTGGRKTAA